MGLPREVGAHVVPAPLHAVEEGVQALGLERVLAPELRVEIGGILRDRGEGVIDLEVDRHGFVVEVLQRDLRLLAEGHGPVAVERAARVHADRQRADLRVAPPAAGEEVSHGHLNRRLRLAIPVKAQDEPARLVERGRRHPDVLDGPRAIQLGKRER